MGLISVTVIPMPDKPVAIRPVVVVSDFNVPSFNYDYTRESMIYMREDLTEALTGLELFSHMHDLPPSSAQRVAGADRVQ